MQRLRMQQGHQNMSLWTCYDGNPRTGNEYEEHVWVGCEVQAYTARGKNALHGRATVHADCVIDGSHQEPHQPDPAWLRNRVSKHIKTIGAACLSCRRFTVLRTYFFERGRRKANESVQDYINMKRRKICVSYKHRANTLVPPTPLFWARIDSPNTSSGKQNR